MVKRRSLPPTTPEQMARWRAARIPTERQKKIGRREIARIRAMLAEVPTDAKGVPLKLRMR